MSNPCIIHFLITPTIDDPCDPCQRPLCCHQPAGGLERVGLVASPRDQLRDAGVAAGGPKEELMAWAWQKKLVAMANTGNYSARDLAERFGISEQKVQQICWRYIQRLRKSVPR